MSSSRLRIWYVWSTWYGWDLLFIISKNKDDLTAIMGSIS